MGRHRKRSTLDKISESDSQVWHAIKDHKKRLKAQAKKRSCLKCSKEFDSKGFSNRLCYYCRTDIEENLSGVIGMITGNKND